MTTEKLSTAREHARFLWAAEARAAERVDKALVEAQAAEARGEGAAHAWAAFARADEDWVRADELARAAEWVAEARAEGV